MTALCECIIDSSYNDREEDADLGHAAKLAEQQHFLVLEILVSKYLQKLPFLEKQNSDNFLSGLADNFTSQKAK